MLSVLVDIGMSLFSDLALSVHRVGGEKREIYTHIHIHI